MTTEDQIRDEKLQYYINREDTKISALLSGKIDKYEYLIGEEILPSNQQQIIEQGKFTYSLLGKAFEKQTKTIENQGKKQVDALKTLESLKPKKVKLEETKAIDYDNYYIDRMVEMRNKFPKIDLNSLTHCFKGNTVSINFIGFKGPLHIFKSIYNDSIALEDVEEEQKSLKTKLGEISMGNLKNKSKKQYNVINNATNLYESRQKVVQMLFYGFLTFARNIGTNAVKVAKNMSNKYGQKLPDTAKKSATDAIKTGSKRAIQKTAEATGDLFGNKIADKITSASKKPCDEESSSY